MEYKTLHFELESASIEQKGSTQYGIIRGAMATEDVDRGNDIISPDAFDKTLARYKKAKRRIKLYYQHNTKNVPIGGIDPKNVVKNGKRWDIVGELDFGVALANEVYSALKNGNLSDMSIGFSINDYDLKNDKRIIKELELWEVSVVGEPMNPKADIVDVKNDKNDKDGKDGKEPTLTLDEIPSHGYPWEGQKNIEKNIFIDYNDICDKVDTIRYIEKLLRDSGRFSKKAATYLCSKISIKQSDSAESTNKEHQEKSNDIKDVVVIKKLDELLNVISNFKRG